MTDIHIPCSADAIRKAKSRQATRRADENPAPGGPDFVDERRGDKRQHQQRHGHPA